MSESNGDWGRFNDSKAPDRAPLYHEWSQYQEFDGQELPAQLLKFMDDRHLSGQAMRAAGARWFIENGHVVLSYLFPDAVKYRKILDAKRWTSPTGVTWRSMKIIMRDTTELPEGIIVVEGETDGAQAHQLFPTWSVGVLPAGALTYTAEMDRQLSTYRHVLVGLDNDQAGDDGANRILERRSNARRLRPPDGAKDWCEARAQGLVDVGWDPLAHVEALPDLPVYSLREVALADLGSYEDNNWFEQDILPRSGSCIIHAPQKSLKSVIMLDMIRALATGTSFAASGTSKWGDQPGGYGFVGNDPARCLLFQMEIRPEGFQRRVHGWLEQIAPEHKDLYLDNTFVYKIVDGELPRLKIGSDDFRSTVLRAIDATRADVVAFDPLQRLTGAADLNSANELEALLDFFAELQNQGLTVLSCHHNNKAAGSSARHASAMTGSQRFAADADSICSVWWDDACGSDDNEDRRKTRNFSWTLRNGAALSRSITVVPAVNSALMYVTFADPQTIETIAVDNGAPEL